MINDKNSKPDKIKISIIEDNVIFSEWIKTELQSEELFDVISVDKSARKGIESVRKHNPELVLLDFQLEDLTGLEVAKRINAYNKKINIFILTAHTEISIIERIINEKSIKGFAIKGSLYFGLNLRSAIKNVAVGEVYLEPSILNQLRESGKSNGVSDLTRREFEVFIQSSSGKKDEKIAADLCVELAYIKNIKSKIAKKIKNANLDSLLFKLIENADPKKRNK